ncbi:MAG: sulfatase-like hydrolase/transferase, partial [Solirubrobacterales bacterium]
MMLPATRSRGPWRLLAGAGALAAGLLLFGAVATADARRPPPNIVTIVTDDQPLSMMDERALPNTFKLLADRGTSFTDSIVTTPLCCPSRAVLMTGQYAHNNGVARNNYGKLKQKRNTLPAWLQNAGYTTAHVGRYMNGYEGRVTRATEVAPGWDRWQTMIAPRAFYDYPVSANGKRLSFGDSDRDYVTRVINRKSARLARKLAKKSDPFYLQVDQFAPHRGVGGDGEACVGAALPDPRDLDAFGGEPLPDGGALNEADVSDKPSFVQALDPLDAAKLENLRVQYRCGLASLIAVDRGVKRLVSAIDRAGELGRTVFI